MSERMEVRVSDSDPEILAMKALSQALAPLDREGAIRILRWADDRFGLGSRAASVERDTKAVDNWLKSLTQAIQATTESARKAGVDAGTLLLTIDRMYTEAAKDAAEKDAAELAERDEEAVPA